MRGQFSNTYEMVKAAEALAGDCREADDEAVAEMLVLLCREIRAMVEIMTGRAFPPAEYGGD